MYISTYQISFSTPDTSKFSTLQCIKMILIYHVSVVFLYTYTQWTVFCVRAYIYTYL